MPVARQIVQLEVAAADRELAADALWQGSPSAVSELDLDDGRVRLTADVAELGKVDPRWRLELLELDSEEHLDAWRAWAAPVRAGRGIVLQPAWLSGEERRDDELVLLLDPGRAFGSGSHPSTRLVLAILEDVVVGGDTVLDVGCGSGVLAIAACRLGAASAVAVDIDPAAIAATSANAAANGVAAQVAVSLDPLEDVVGRFDLVVANIGAAALRGLAAALVARVRPGGLLVLAGLLVDQVAAVVDACPGCTTVECRDEDGWSAQVLRRVARH